MLPNSGDELQGIKKGIIELADALVINKADGDSVKIAEQTCAHFKSALKMLRHNTFWKPRVLSCSAMLKTNIDTVWEMICDYHVGALENGTFKERRTRQNKDWLQHLITELLHRNLNQNEQVKQLKPELEKKVLNGEITPFLAATRLIKLL